MKLPAIFRREASAPVVMQGDAVLEQLAQHLVALAYGDGELPDGRAIPGGQRDRFIRLTPLSRAVDIICALTAQMICNGGLTVRDRMDNKVENRRTMAALNLLSHSPDGGMTPAVTFVEDVMADYLLDGNGLVVPTMAGSTMVPLILTRYRPHGAYTVRTDNGPLAYLAMRAHGPRGTLETISGREMMHIRWPLKQRGHLGEDGREHFAVSPVTLFARAMVTGLLQDSYTQRRYRKAPSAQLAIKYDPANMEDVTPEQRAELQAAVAARLGDSPILASIGGDVVQIDSAPVHEHVVSAREFQVQEVARIYGLPLPLLSAPIGQWTRGVNEQVMKMAWRTGVSVHLNRFLAPFQTRLLVPGERFVVDPTEFVRGDASAIAELVNATQGDAQRDPVASREELRHAAGWPRVPDGEIRETRQMKTGGGSNAGEARP